MMASFGVPVIIALIVGVVWAGLVPVPSGERRFVWTSVPFIALVTLHGWSEFAYLGMAGHLDEYNLIPVAAGGLVGAVLGIFLGLFLRPSSAVASGTVTKVWTTSFQLLAALLAGGLISQLALRNFVLLEPALFSWSGASGNEGTAAGISLLYVGSGVLGMTVLALIYLPPQRAATTYRAALFGAHAAVAALILHAQSRIRPELPSWWLDALVTNDVLAAFGALVALNSFVVLLRAAKHDDATSWSLALLVLGQSLHWAYNGAILRRAGDAVDPRGPARALYAGFMEIAQIVLVGQLLIVLLTLGLMLALRSWSSL